MSAATTLEQARDLYLEREGLSTETYVEDWAQVYVGPLPLRFPNLEVRKRVLPLHDLHHALTGYAADWTGEAEIAAWELGGGLGPHWIGYVLDLMTLSWSMVATPRRVWKAFVRGRNSSNFYNAPLPLDPAMMNEDLADVRQRLGLADNAKGTVADGLALAGWYLAALPLTVFGLASLPLMVALGLWGQLKQPA